MTKFAGQSLSGLVTRGVHLDLMLSVNSTASIFAGNLREEIHILLTDILSQYIANVLPEESFRVFMVINGGLIQF